MKPTDTMTDDTKPWPHGLDLIADNPVTCKHNGVYYEDANTKVCLYCGVKVLASETKPESANGREKAMCPKCGSISGDDWTQCGGSCPMPISPHYKKPNDTKPESERELEKEYIRGLALGAAYMAREHREPDYAKWIIEDNGFSREHLIEAGVEDCDIKDIYDYEG